MRRKTAAREVALQALYAWQLSGGDPLDEARAIEGYEESEFVKSLLKGVQDGAPELEKGAEAVRVALEMARLKAKISET